MPCIRLAIDCRCRFITSTHQTQIILTKFEVLFLSTLTRELVSKSFTIHQGNCIGELKICENNYVKTSMQEIMAFELRYP